MVDDVVAGLISFCLIQLLAIFTELADMMLSASRKTDGLDGISTFGRLTAYFFWSVR